MLLTKDLVYCVGCGMIFVKDMLEEHYYPKRANGEYICPVCNRSHTDKSKLFKEIYIISESEV